MKAKPNKMKDSKILPLLVNMSIPPTISMLINSMYNIVDSIFVARLGTEALTAVSLAFPVQNLILSLAVGLGVGVNSYLSRKLGEEHLEEANNTGAHGLVLACIQYLIFCVICYFFVRPFFGIFTENQTLIDMSCDYTYILAFLSIGTMLQIAIEKILQATGNTLAPMYLQIIGAVTNIILDPIMIYGYLGCPAMGVKGAAIATVCGQMVALACSIYVLFFRKQEVHISLRGFKWSSTTVKEIYNVGVPSFFIMSISSFLVMGINYILSAFSDLAVALYGIYYKLQTFVYMPTIGVTQGAMPIMGFNYGARNKRRLSDTLNYSIILCVVMNIIGSIIFWIFPEEILFFFKASPDMLEMGVNTLRIISISYAFGSVCFILSSFLQAIGKGFPSLLITLLRQFILILPLAFFLGRTRLGINGVWMAFPIVEIVMFFVSILIYRHVSKGDRLISRRIIRY